jgi:hypothetical protein
MIALAVEADDEHGPAVAVTSGLIGCEDRRVSTLGRAVADAFPEAAMAELVGATEELNGEVGVIWS